MDLNMSQENAIDFIVQKTDLPREVVEKLSNVEIPRVWTEGVRAILENFNNPEALDLHSKMIVERVEYVKRLPDEEIVEIEEIKVVDAYMKRLQLEGNVTADQAAMFTVAILQWHTRVEEFLIDSIENKAKEN